MMQVVEVGSVLAGKYRVEKVLGIGGMGMVVAATHLELEQRVAIKFMLPDGHVIDAVVDAVVDAGKKVALAKCVADKLKATTFPKTHKGGAFSQTFNF